MAPLDDIPSIRRMITKLSPHWGVPPAKRPKKHDLREPVQWGALLTFFGVVFLIWGVTFACDHFGWVDDSSSGGGWDYDPPERFGHK